jgi:hypothetical protein
MGMVDLSLYTTQQIDQMSTIVDDDMLGAYLEDSKEHLKDLEQNNAEAYE